MGLGLLGRGVGDVAYLAECGAELIVTDKKTREALAESLSKLSGYSNIGYVLGEHRMEDFEGRDMILVAAGVPMDSPYLVHAREHNVPLVQSAALFAQLSGIPIIGVTGTRGKSTVTHMIHHVLCQTVESGLDHSFGMNGSGTQEGVPGMVGNKTQCGVLLGGNVRGVSNLQLLNEVEEDSIAVMELDSWQLQGFGWAKISPHIAVFTTFMEDHMNYYQRDLPDRQAGMDAYFADKANIFKYQEESGVLVTTQDVFTWAQKFMKKEGEEFHQEIKLTDASLLPEDCLLSMPGEHNRLNAALATEALRATGLTDEEIFEGLATFPGVPGRLEYLGEQNGVKIYNDNNSTTPTATIVGLKAVSEGKNVVLIMGGDEKNLDMSGLMKEIPEHCSKVVLFKERGTDRIRDDVFALKEQGVDVYEEQGLEATVARALEVAKPGEVILYSPAFSSFGTYFKNEYDRNDQFVKLVRAQRFVD